MSHLSSHIMAPSDLSFIEIKNSSNPRVLLAEWIQEAKKFDVPTHLMNVATAAKNGKVGNRTVVIREILSDGSLSFIAQRNSRKIRDINENPEVAATVLLMYHNGDQLVNRQVRFTGNAEILSKEQCKVYFEQEKLPGKIRAWICQDCAPTEWNDLKRRHDELLKDITDNKKELEMPDTLVAYKIVPHEIDFYSSVGNTIADRVVYRSTGTNWTYEHVMA